MSLRLLEIVWLRTVLLGLTISLLVTGLLVSPQVRAGGPEDDLADANSIVQRALTAARVGDFTTAKQEYTRYENTWFNIEDGIRAKSHEAYRAIEKDMTDVSRALAANPVNREQMVNALVALDREQQLFIKGLPPTSSDSPSSGGASTTPTMSAVINRLRNAQTALGQGNYAAAAEQVRAFQTGWLDVEGEVKTRSADDYRQTETDMALAETLSAQGSPDAAAVISRMITRLEPYRQAGSYGIFDASIILLREGLEALLVLVALLAFLQRSGNKQAQGWVWGGATIGLIASIVLGLAIQAFFSAIINPSNRELMEGAIGLVAAVMLVYVSYWLHNQASARGWARFISQRSTEVIQGGRLVGMAVLAFLAVFREGAETALFFLGMVGNISTSDLFIGLVVGFVGLAVLGFLMTVMGIRIPLRPFFAVASVLVFYLCFKFLGTGIHGLQIAGIIPAVSASYLPSIDVLGMYPTWPTTLAQLLLLTAGLWVVLHERLQQPLAARAGQH